MKLPTIECAEAVRDSGIDALAALNQGLQAALAAAPSIDHSALKLAFGRLMSDISDALINKAVEQYPELEPDQAAWLLVVARTAAARASAAEK